jgi:hypothetical protein
VCVRFCAESVIVDGLRLNLYYRDPSMCLASAQSMNVCFRSVDRPALVTSRVPLHVDGLPVNASFFSLVLLVFCIAMVVPTFCTQVLQYHGTLSDYPKDRWTIEEHHLLQ